MFANSLLILFSSNSLALAFLKSAMNCTKPRMLDPFPEFPRLRKPAAAEDAIVSCRSQSRSLSTSRFNKCPGFLTLCTQCNQDLAYRMPDVPPVMVFSCVSSRLIASSSASARECGQIAQPLRIQPCSWNSIR
jgi:hypothetical protein